MTLLTLFHKRRNQAPYSQGGGSVGGGRKRKRERSLDDVWLPPVFRAQEKAQVKKAIKAKPKVVQAKKEKPKAKVFKKIPDSRVNLAEMTRLENEYRDVLRGIQIMSTKKAIEKHVARAREEEEAHAIMLLMKRRRKK